jgi:hypothetical protein
VTRKFTNGKINHIRDNACAEPTDDRVSEIKRSFDDMESESFRTTYLFFRQGIPRFNGLRRSNLRAVKRYSRPSGGMARSEHMPGGAPLFHLAPALGFRCSAGFRLWSAIMPFFDQIIRAPPHQRPARLQITHVPRRDSAKR